MKRQPYAYQCTRCEHLSAAHRLAPDGDLRNGPYRCLHEGCGCERPQDGPDIGLTRRQYEALPNDVRNWPIEEPSDG